MELVQLSPREPDWLAPSQLLTLEASAAIALGNSITEMARGLELVQEIIDTGAWRGHSIMVDGKPVQRFTNFWTEYWPEHFRVYYADALVGEYSEAFVRARLRWIAAMKELGYTAVEALKVSLAEQQALEAAIDFRATPPAFKDSGESSGLIEEVIDRIINDEELAQVPGAKRQLINELTGPGSEVYLVGTTKLLFVNSVEQYSFDGTRLPHWVWQILVGRIRPKRMEK